MEANSIYDRCFNLSQNDAVVCGADPLTGNPGFRLDLSAPLPEPELHPSEEPRAWLVELVDGTSCTPFTGTRPFIKGQIAYYGCASNTTGRQILLLGELDTSKPAWTAKKAILVKSISGWNMKSSKAVPVKAVWQ